ncbi:MAG: hypothetical protein AAF901_02030 [Bacteroidota bacterium]
MKHAIKILALVLTTFTFAQTPSLNGKVTKDDVKFEDFKITVTADSAEEVESTFKVQDLEEIFESSAPNTDITFKIICNGDLMSNGEPATMSYTVIGNTDNKEGFLERVKKVRSAAIEYYNNK